MTMPELASEVCLDRVRRENDPPDRFLILLTIDEDQPVRLLADAGLTARDPVPAGQTQRGPVMFRRDQSSFYMTARRVRGRGAAKRLAPPPHVSRPAPRPVL